MAGRIDTVIKALGAAKRDALVAFTTSFHSFLETDAVLLLAGFKPMGESAVVVARDPSTGLGRAALIVTPAWDLERARERSHLERVIAADDPVAPITQLLAEWRIAPDKVALAGHETLPHEMESRILAALPSPANFDEVVLNLAKCKTREEIEHARQAARVAQMGYQRMLELAKPGMHEFELAAELYTYMRGLGSDDNFLLVSASQHNPAVCAPSRRILEQGDIILAEITPSWRGQFAQICRSVSVGKPSEVLVEKYDLLCRIMQVGMKAAVPGVTVSEVTRAMDNVFAQAGYADYCRPPFMRVRGHGLGRLSSQPGDITIENQTVLEEDMVFVMHPNQYLPETGYLLCGEPVRITKNGAEALSPEMATLGSVSA
jgi:Xaa-Pro aminopeptidase